MCACLFAFLSCGLMTFYVASRLGNSTKACLKCNRARPFAGYHEFHTKVTRAVVNLSSSHESFSCYRLSSKFRFASLIRGEQVGLNKNDLTMEEGSSYIAFLLVAFLSMDYFSSALVIRVSKRNGNDSTSCLMPNSSQPRTPCRTLWYAVRALEEEKNENETVFQFFHRRPSLLPRKACKYLTEKS